jgi:hypothetical protein
MLGPLFALGNLAAQNIDVLVLDALNGKPQQGVLVHWFCEGQRPASSDERTTDNNGIAEVPFPCGNQGRIELSVLAPDWKKHAYAKTECGELGPITLQNISQAGIISNPSADGNIWCPTKISRKLKPVPGQVTIFIKKPTWYQVHFAG